MRMESSWSSLPQAPNIMAPRQSGLTFTPVLPRVRYSMRERGYWPSRSSLPRVRGQVRSVPRPGAATALVLAGIVLIAVNLRPGITVVGPLVEEIRTDLGLSNAGVGASRAGLMVAVMQFVSIASAIGVPVLAARRRNQQVLVAASAATMLAGFVGLLAAGAFLAPLWAGLLGLAGGSFLSLALTFLVVRARDAHQTAALSGMVQSGGYLLAASGPTAIGALRDLSGGWTLPLLAFIVVTLAALVSGLAAGRDRLGLGRGGWGAPLFP